MVSSDIIKTKINGVRIPLQSQQSTQNKAMPRLLNNARDVREGLKRRDSDSDVESVYSMTIGTPKSDRGSSCSDRFGSPDGDDKSLKYSRADFDGLEITSVELDLFNEAWQEFTGALNHRCTNSGNDKRVEAVLLAKPNALRVINSNGEKFIPQSVESFEQFMPIAYLSKEAVKKKKYLEKKFVDAFDGAPMGGPIVNKLEFSPRLEEDESSHIERQERIVYEQVNSMHYYCNGIHKLLQQDPIPWGTVFEQILVATDSLFDTQLHMVFGAHSPVERVETILQRIGEVWQKVLAREGDDYELERLEGVCWKTSMEKFLADCQHDLNNGMYVTGHENPFKDTVFPFRQEDNESAKEAAEKARREKEEEEAEAARLKEEEEKRKAAAARADAKPRRVFGSWKRSKPEPPATTASTEESKRARTDAP